MTETIPNTLGGRIRQARREAGFRNTESLAVRLDVAQRTVQRWETDRFEPSISKLHEIAVLTGKPLAYFISAYDGVAA